jgi:hypothetical protein
MTQDRARTAPVIVLTYDEVAGSIDRINVALAEKHARRDGRSPQEIARMEGMLAKLTQVRLAMHEVGGAAYREVVAPVHVEPPPQKPAT